MRCAALNAIRFSFLNESFDPRVSAVLTMWVGFGFGAAIAGVGEETVEPDAGDQGSEARAQHLRRRER